MNTFTYIIIPLLIFFARIIDVSLGTIRMILISRGEKKIAAGIGFIEVFIWLIAIKEILNNLSSIGAYIAYPAGFAAGTYIGMLLEEKLLEGKVVLRVIVKPSKENIASTFKKEKIPYTLVKGEGANGPSRVFFCIMDRKKTTKVIELINEINPEAFYSVEPIKFASETNTHQKTTKTRRLFSFHRKGK